MRKSFHQGSLTISESVIDFILEVAINETPGVKFIEAPVKKTLRKMVGKGKKASFQYDSYQEDAGLSLKVEVAIGFGEIIPYTCFVLQERIKNDIEKMTGLHVEEVNVLVSALSITDEYLNE
ncbi:Asp23/Gls24 family envelope stress response protein [Anaerobacillus sp. 1_MG-2023]|uniref:Asp23/Gls24 family envelope stress response protein n=1 Tax=Anaerobacillus sp. 1_MG-2023 TaxID=3062655 RepID=UPI0026E1DA7E|nr:Asp23/Gls24 family envelope stress response protein [Anaerobacillus sp. 1_MG-2023]MDO6655504.1 Asp23/Gls24 family envelope stress response protein [Anaerobacillus sp. 1_MG-2023]